MIGWQCPGCGRGYSPLTAACGWCGPTTTVSGNANACPSEDAPAPITAEDLQAFLAPGVTAWVMTRADLERLAAWIAERRG
jgi:hypothetical protein